MNHVGERRGRRRGRHRPADGARGFGGGVAQGDEFFPDGRDVESGMRGGVPVQRPELRVGRRAAECGRLQEQTQRRDIGGAPGGGFAFEPARRLEFQDLARSVGFRRFETAFRRFAVAENHGPAIVFRRVEPVGAVTDESRFARQCVDPIAYVADRGITGRDDHRRRGFGERTDRHECGDKGVSDRG